MMRYGNSSTDFPFLLKHSFSQPTTGRVALGREYLKDSVGLYFCSSLVLRQRKSETFQIFDEGEHI
jgi:hypothetical protein